MPQDLRTYLDLLISTYPDQLKVVSSRVDPEFEATAIVDRIEDDPARYPGFPAVLFKDVGGASMPVLLNLHATYERLALSIGTDVKGMVPEYAAREGRRIPTVTVDASAAPVQEVVLTGDDIDVGLLPMLIHNELDAGKYITSACTLMKDPDSGRINAGIFRHQYQGPRQVGIQVNPAHHTGYILRQLRELGKPAEVALVIGHHPAVLMGAVSKLEGIGGELEVAGGLMGEPLEMVKAKTVDLGGAGTGGDRDRGDHRHRPRGDTGRGPVRRVPALLHARRPTAVREDHGDHDARQADLPRRLQRPYRALDPWRAAADGLDLPPRQGGDALCDRRQPAH